MACNPNSNNPVDFWEMRRGIPGDVEMPGEKGTAVFMRRVERSSQVVVELPLLALLVMVFTLAVMVTPDFELRLAGLHLPALYTCPLFAVTGIPCLLCGMTRSFMAMGSFDIGRAFEFHPLGPVLFFLMALLAVGLVFSLASGQRLVVRPGAALKRRLLAWGSLLLLGAWVLKIIVWRRTGLI